MTKEDLIHKAIEQIINTFVKHIRRGSELENVEVRRDIAKTILEVIQIIETGGLTIKKPIKSKRK